MHFLFEIEGRGLTPSPPGTAVFKEVYNFAALDEDAMFHYASKLYKTFLSNS